MRTIFLALVLGLFCTATAFAQPETINKKPAPEVKVTPKVKASTIVEPAPAVVVEPEVVVESAAVANTDAPTCVNGVCRPIQPIRNLVVRPVANVVKGTMCATQRVACRTKQRVQRFRQCRPRLFQRCCR